MLRSQQRLAQQLVQIYYSASVGNNVTQYSYSCSRCSCRIPNRNVTTNSATEYIKEKIDSGKWNLKDKLKKIGILDFSKNRLKRQGYYIYSEIADGLDYKYFFQKFKLPDTFSSWFVVMELHLWIILVRLMAEGEEGRFVRNSIIEAMWEDIRQKAGLLGAENASRARKQIKILSEEFQAALLSYDEGILSDDIVLAGAIWRRVFARDCSDPELLELLVKYVRKQAKYFDSLSRDEVLLKRNYEWCPLEEK